MDNILDNTLALIKLTNIDDTFVSIPHFIDNVSLYLEKSDYENAYIVSEKVKYKNGKWAEYNERDFISYCPTSLDEYKQVENNKCDFMFGRIDRSATVAAILPSNNIDNYVGNWGFNNSLENGRYYITLYMIFTNKLNYAKYKMKHDINVMYVKNSKEDNNE